MDWFLALLKKLGIDVTKEDIKKILDSADFKAELEKSVPKPNTEGLLTQEQVDKIVQERLKRAEKVHEGELNALREEMKKLVDPAKITEVEAKFKDQLEAANKKAEALTKEMKLREAFHKAGAKDVDYLMYQANQKGLTNRFTVDDKGNVSVIVIGADGKTSPAFKKDGKPMEMADLIDEMKEEFKAYFGEQQPAPSPGPTNPFNFDQNKSFGEQLAAMNAGAGKAAAEGQGLYFGGGKAQ